MSSNWVCSRSFLSSAASGSSSSKSLGRLTRLRASATRWRWPPESWCGLRRVSGKELHQSQNLLHPRRDLGPGHPVLAEAEGDVAGNGHVGKERVRLEHHVDRPPIGRQRGEVHAVEQEGAGVRRLEARENAKQRGLAAARRAEQGEELALLDVERDIVDRDNATEALADALDAKKHALAAGGRRSLSPGVLRPPVHGRRARAVPSSCLLRALDAGPHPGDEALHLGRIGVGHIEPFPCLIRRVDAGVLGDLRV